MTKKINVTPPGPVAVPDGWRMVAEEVISNIGELCEGIGDQQTVECISAQLDRLCAMLAASPQLFDKAEQVPELMPIPDFCTVRTGSTDYAAGWNACRRAMRAAPQPEAQQQGDINVVDLQPEVQQHEPRFHAPGLGEVHDAEHKHDIWCGTYSGDGVAEADDDLAKRVCDALNAQGAQPETPQPTLYQEAWAVFDGEGHYDLIHYEGNEHFHDEYIKRNGEKYADWVKPLFSVAKTQ